VPSAIVHISKHAVSTSSGISQPKFVLKAHGELDSVEAIGAEIVDEISVFCYLISIDAEMFGNDENCAAIRSR
jgi:hypothetical protein